MDQLIPTSSTRPEWCSYAVFQEQKQLIPSDLYCYQENNSDSNYSVHLKEQCAYALRTLSLHINDLEHLEYWHNEELLQTGWNNGPVDQLQIALQSAEDEHELFMFQNTNTPIMLDTPHKIQTQKDARTPFFAIQSCSDNQQKKYWRLFEVFYA